MFQELRVEIERERVMVVREWRAWNGMGQERESKLFCWQIVKLRMSLRAFLTPEVF